MNAIIETYRTFEIHFDTDKSTFGCKSIQLDTEWGNKKSYEAVKKSIDDYIKDNQDFKPFYAQSIGDDEQIKIVGIRKDGSFLFENKKKEKELLSSWYEKKYVVANEADEEIFKKKKVLNEKIEEIRLEIVSLMKGIQGETLESVKAKYVI